MQQPGAEAQGSNSRKLQQGAGENHSISTAEGSAKCIEMKPKEGQKTPEDPEVIKEDGKDTMKLFDINLENWQPQLNWTYAGHGEWIPQELLNTNCNTKRPIKQEAKEVMEWLSHSDKDIKLHQEVVRKGYPNRWGARIPVQSNWNLELMDSLLRHYEDMEVVDWIRYGWPTGRLPTLEDSHTSSQNHKGGIDFQTDLNKYVIKELKKGAIMGPYDNIPFKSKIGISPLSTRPKKNSSECRVILDLSFPEGHSVNDGIQKDYYLGMEAKLTFPRVDDLALRIYELKGDCALFKINLSRYFR